MKKAINTTLDIDATPVEIWDVLIDFPAHEKWNPFFARIVGEATVGPCSKPTRVGCFAGKASFSSTASSMESTASNSLILVTAGRDSTTARISAASSSDSWERS